RAIRPASSTSSGSRSRRSSTNGGRRASLPHTGFASCRRSRRGRVACSGRSTVSSSTDSCKIAGAGNTGPMAPRQELPADVVAAFERVPDARDRLAALPTEQQMAWLNWIDRARGRRNRAARIDEMIRRLLPGAAAAEEEVVEPASPPPERYWWLWLLLLLL